MTTTTASVTVDVPVSAAYQLWTRFEAFPLFMAGVESVRMIGERRLRWVVSGSSGSRELTTTIVGLRLDESIAWICDSGVTYAGAVTMEPRGPMRSRVTLTMTYDAATTVDDAHRPGLQVQDDLDRFRRAALVIHHGAEGGGAAVLDLGDPADLSELESMGDEAPRTIICLWRDGVRPPSWFEKVADTLARRSSVVVLRYGLVTTNAVREPRGGRPGSLSADLAAAVRGAFAGALASRSPGYREIVVRERSANGSSRQPSLTAPLLEAG